MSNTAAAPTGGVVTQPTSQQTPAAPPPSSNPWLKGPPPQLQAQRQQQQQQPRPQQQQQQQPPQNFGANNQQFNQILPPPPPPVQIFRTPVRAGRVHHHLPLEDAQIHAYQLGLAQQMALVALQTGIDLPTYQAQVAMSYGFDPRLLNVTPEPGTRLTGTEPPLGLTLVKDEQAYTHIELLTRYPHIATINFTAVDLEPRRGAFFLATCPERSVHESIKYGWWSIPGEGAPALNRAFGELHGIGPVYILFATTDTVSFSGIAQMMGPASPVIIPEQNAPGAAPAPTGAPGGVPQTPQAQTPSAVQNLHRFPVRWLFSKKIPFGHMSHVALRAANKEAEEARRAHGGLQPMRLNDGTRALGMYARYTSGLSTLMDFKHYDEAEARGIIAESGEAAIRAANKFQQKMFMQNQGGQQHHHQPRQFHPRSHHHENNFNSQQQQPNPSQFPTPAQAANAAAAGQTSAATSPTAVATSNAPAAGGERPNQREFHPRERRPHQQRQSHNAPPRRLVTADEERVTLPTKYVFEPVMKEKQKDRRRRRQAQAEDEQMEGGENVEGGEGQEEPQQEDAAQETEEMIEGQDGEHQNGE
jgi:hypothetical protein